jgi:hypothetical protein
VVFFGDSVPGERVARALRPARRERRAAGGGLVADGLFGFRFARPARDGKPIACLNLGHTRADALYSLKVEASVGETLNALAAALMGAGQATG